MYKERMIRIGYILRNIKGIKYILGNYNEI